MGFHTERRAHARRESDIRGVIHPEDDEDTLEVRAINVSRGGTFLAGDLALEQGQRFHLELELPQAGPVHFMVEVRRRVTPSDAQKQDLTPGIGVQLRDASPWARALWDGFVSAPAATSTSATVLPHKINLAIIAAFLALLVAGFLASLAR